MEKKALQALRDGFEEARQSLSSYDGKFDKLALKKAKLVLQYQARLSAIREANEALLEAQTRHIEAVSDLELLKLRSEDVMRRLEDEKKKVEELVDQENQVKTQAQGAKSLVQNLLANSDGDLDPERRDFLVKLCEGKTLDAINEDIETENAKLDLIHQADPGVLRDFEKRAKEIERLQAENDSRRAALEELDEGIRGLRRTWEPALDEIIRRINDAFSFNFEQINCAGEVGVHKDEDFDKWAIEVKVKFRYDAFTILPMPQQPPLSSTNSQLFAGKTRPSRNSTNTGNPAASAPSRPSSTSCPCNRWPRRPSAW